MAVGQTALAFTCLRAANTTRKLFSMFLVMIIEFPTDWSMPNEAEMMIEKYGCLNKENWSVTFLDQ